MTHFTQLDGSLSKSAMARAAWQGLKGVASNGVWKTIGNAAGKRTGALSKGVKSTADVMGGKVGKGLGVYGLAGLAVPSLPGSQLAMNVAMPGWGAATTAPGVITAGRMASGKNQARLKEDVMTGGRSAVNDFITSLNASPDVAYRPGGYRQFLSSNGVDLSGADAFKSNAHAGAMSRWKQLQSIFSDPQTAIDHKTKQIIQEQLNKHAGIGAGLGKALTWGGGLLSAYGIGNAALRDKPYDEVAAQTAGYDGATAGIDKKLEGMTGFQRFMAKMDPTLIAGQVDKALPGSIANWESQTGNKYQPGLISSTINAWKSGGKPSYYEYDAAGQRHYTT